MKSAAKAINRIGRKRLMSMARNPTGAEGSGSPFCRSTRVGAVRRGGGFQRGRDCRPTRHGRFRAARLRGPRTAATPVARAPRPPPVRAPARPAEAGVRPALRGRVTSQVLAARDVPSAGLTTLYVTTSAGLVYAVSETGYVRWRVDLGQLANDCPQLDGYGVTAHR